MVQVLWGKGFMVNCAYKGPWKNKANSRRMGRGLGDAGRTCCTNKPNWRERIMQNEANHRQSLPPRRRGMPMPQAYPTPRAIALENSLASNTAGG